MRKAERVFSIAVAAAVVIGSVAYGSPEPEMPAMQELHFRITASDGTPIPGATVAVGEDRKALCTDIYRESQVMRVSDSKGVVAFANLPAGTYYISFRMPGFVGQVWGPLKVDHRAKLVGPDLRVLLVGLMPNCPGSVC